MSMEPDEFEHYGPDYGGYIDEPVDPMTVKEKILLAIVCFAVGALIGVVWTAVRG